MSELKSEKFVHLHVHSEYSLLEAACRIKGLAKAGAEDGMPAMALTDNGNMFGAIEFYFACKDKGVQPIMGFDAYIAPEGRLKKSQAKNSRLVLLAEDLEGYRNLCQLSTIGYQEGFYYKPRIDFEVLKKFSDQLICLTGGVQGEIAQKFLNEGPDQALASLRNLKEIFSDRLYLEITRMGLAQTKELEAFLIEAGRIVGVPLVAANDVHYLTPDDQMAQEVLVCIGTNRTLQDETRLKLGSSQFYLKSSMQMRSLFSDLPEACDRTLEIAERCQVQFKLKDALGKPIYHLPSFTDEDPELAQLSLKDLIAKKAHQGLDRRFAERVENPVITEVESKQYRDRLDFELGVIDRMGFNGYFLIVHDFIDWAKKHDIPVGPGRGSGAGSLVAFSLRITDIDPIPHFLLFERFLNPERISMPDFDIDFCQDRRPEVIQYVTQKYGSGSVSQIITYGKLQARAAIKDVGRVLGMTFNEVDVVTKLIPEKLGINLKESLELEPRLREMVDMNPQIATLMDLARRVEGMVRHAGIHAAGVIIADGNLVQHAPLYRAPEGENVVQYDMKHAEKIGLIKFDFLGLKTLTHIQHALKLIVANRGKTIQPHEIPLNDPKVFEVMASGDTAGVFQFEGEGITDATRKIKPSVFGDLVAITSLYRPGPMANIPEFAKRKNGETPVEFLLPESAAVLKDTYGIMVYQEQVMGIASTIAGYSLGEADMLRRAMGKKIKEEMDQHRERFLKGASERGHDRAKSEELFDLMYKFADYGFNKSHAAAYSVLTVQTAWLKGHYPTEFFAALLSTELGNTDNVVKYVKDAQKHKLLVLPPNVNVSNFLFTVKGDDIYFGLGAIKGVGESALAAIFESREKQTDKKFTTLQHFFKAVDGKKLNKKVIECLIKAGALDSFGYHRAELMLNYPQLLEEAQDSRHDEEVGQFSLFAQMDVDDAKDTMDGLRWQKTAPWSKTQSLAFEKEVLGFYLSDHPLRGMDHMAKKWVKHKIAELPAVEGATKANKKRVVVLGIMQELREVITKKGTRMAFGKLEDLSGSCELVIFPDVFAENLEKIKDERPLLVGGTLENEDGGCKIIVDSVSPLEEVFKRAKSITVFLDQVREDKYLELQTLLKSHPGKTKVDLRIKLPDLDQELSIDSEQPMTVLADGKFFEKMQTIIGDSPCVDLNI